MFSSPANLQTSLKSNRSVRICITYEWGQPSVYREGKTHGTGIAWSVLKTHPKLSFHLLLFFFSEWTSLLSCRWHKWHNQHTGTAAGKAPLIGACTQQAGSRVLLVGICHGIFSNFPAGVHERGMQNVIYMLWILWFKAILGGSDWALPFNVTLRK